MAALKSVQAPLMTSDADDDSEAVDTSAAKAPNVILDWEEISFGISNCAPHLSASSDWVWTARLDWPCRVSTSRYLDALLENPILVPGETSTITGRLVSPNRTVRLTKAENHPRPTQGSRKGSGLTLTFTVNRPLQR